MLIVGVWSISLPTFSTIVVFTVNSVSQLSDWKHPQEDSLPKKIFFIGKNIAQPKEIFFNVFIKTPKINEGCFYNVA